MTPADPFRWPPSPHWATWTLLVKLDALCRRHEAKQGWVPCRVLRRITGVSR